MGGSPGLAGGSDVITRVLLRRGRKASSWKRRCDNGSRGWSDFMEAEGAVLEALEVEEGARSQGPGRL